MPNYQQPNTAAPILDPNVASYPVGVHVNKMIPGPIKAANHIQPNTANPTVDPRVGVSAGGEKNLIGGPTWPGNYVPPK